MEATVTLRARRTVTGRTYPAELLTPVNAGPARAPLSRMHRSGPLRLQADHNRTVPSGAK